MRAKEISTPLPSVEAERRPREAKVDCGTCTACCRHEIVVLEPTDDESLWLEAEPLETPGGLIGARLRHRPDGACVFLGEAGCTVYEKRPMMCRVFSCVDMVRGMMRTRTRNERRAMLKDPRFDRNVWDAGKARLRKGTADG